MMSTLPSRLSELRASTSGWLRLWLQVGAFALWLAATVYGGILLWNFSLEPGQQPSTTSRWPDGSGLRAPSGQPMLVLFLHPLCPCSRATVEELSVLLAKADGALGVQAVFVGGAQGRQVEESSLWKQVMALPGVTLLTDPDGAEAAKFHSATSGDAFLYDSTGALHFRGGLTAARGHAGDNFGVDSIVRILREGKDNPPVRGPVFGCLLANPQSPPAP